MASNIYQDIAEDVETRFCILNYELNRPLAKEKSKKLIALRRYELDRKIMTNILD